MINESVDIRVPGSYEDSEMITYFPDFKEEFGLTRRPVVLVLPGGGYEYKSPREGEPIALTFNAMGYAAAVLKYSVVKKNEKGEVIWRPESFDVAFKEVGKAVHFLRENADKYGLLADAVIICGFSAGGHLACAYSLLYKKLEIAKALGLSEDKEKSLRPDAMILGYPVITSGEYAHRGSFVNLLGDDYDRYLDLVSLEKQVTSDAPPAFLWDTFEDGAVPCMNCLLYTESCYKAGVPCEYHMFERGGHGIALATEFTESTWLKEKFPEAAVWPELAKHWLNLRFSLKK